MAKLVSKTYSDALFGIAVEQDLVDALMEEVEQVLQIWKDNPEMKQLLTHPKIPKEERRDIVKEVFHDRVSEIMEGFLVTLVDKDRIRELEDVGSFFMGTVKEYKNIGVATVTTAVEMTDEQKRQVVDRLLSLTKYVEFETDYRVDGSLIGGMVIRIGDRVVDGSVRHKLDAMAKDLTKIQL